MTHIHFCFSLRSSGLFLAAFFLTLGLVIAQPPRINPTGVSSTSVLSSLRQGADGLLTIENSQIRVGINTNAGGAITYLTFKDDHGGKVNTRNMVSNPDLGRQIQIGVYSGPLDFTSGATSGWVGLGWNPIQAGDVFGNPSQVLAVEKQDNLLYAKTLPKQFAFNNSSTSPEKKPDESMIEHWIRLDGNIVKVHAKLTMFRSDKTQYEGRQQEFPCVYLTGDYHNMWYYKDASPFTNGDLTLTHIQPPATAMFGDIFPTEPWMASTNDNGYGVGLYVVGNNYEWKRGYFGADLGGDEFSPVASYIAATNRVILDYNMVYEWDYELILGHLNEIRSYVYNKPRAAPGPNFLFDTSRKGWSYGRATDTGLPISGKLHIQLDDPVNAYITSPFVFWKARDNPKIYLRAAFKTHANRARIKWRRSDETVMYGDEAHYMDFPIINDGQYHVYEIDLSHNKNWLDYTIGQIEFKMLADQATSGDWIDFAWVASKSTGPTPELTNEFLLPCEPACLTLGIDKVQYIKSNRKR